MRYLFDELLKTNEFRQQNMEMKARKRGAGGVESSRSTIFPDLDRFALLREGNGFQTF